MHFAMPGSGGSRADTDATLRDGGGVATDGCECTPSFAPLRNLNVWLVSESDEERLSV